MCSYEIVTDSLCFVIYGIFVAISFFTVLYLSIEFNVIDFLHLWVSII